MLWIMILVLVVIIVIAVAAIPVIKIRQEEFEKTGKRPQGYYMGMGIAIGIAIGLPLGIAMDTIALGPALGLAIGTAIGAALEQKHAGEVRPRTEKEKQWQRLALVGGVILLMIGVAALAAIVLLGN